MITRFRAEQVGSLLRPPELLAARSAFAAGQISLDELRRLISSEPSGSTFYRTASCAAAPGSPTWPTPWTDSFPKK
jgi:hypothetical protein